MTDNEDKIKVLENAIKYLEKSDNDVGICDAINNSIVELDLNYAVFSDHRLYNIVLPPRDYEYMGCFAFSFPLTKKGKLQRIEFLKSAITKLQSI